MHLATSTDGARAVLPLYLQVAGDMRQLIQNGAYKPGDRLPSVRELRRRYRVSTATIVEAYVRLERDGVVRARERSGFFAAFPSNVAEPTVPRSVLPPVEVETGELIANVLRGVNSRNLVPLGIAAPSVELLPTRELNRALRRAAARQPLHSAMYEHLSGNPALRRQIVRLQFTAGFNGSPEDVVITNGGLEALNLALRAVVKPGEVVAVESPTYFGILQAIESLGVQAVEVPSHPKHGINLELLEHAIRRHRAKAVVVMTNCHNPLGTIMTDAAKKQLVELTHHHDVAVIEDDIYGDLAYGQVRPRTAKSYDRKGLVLLCGSFSKVLAPGLRVGWIEAGRFRPQAEVLKSITSLSTSSLPQLAVLDLLESGFYDRFIRRLRIHLEDHIRRYSSAIAELFPEGTRMSKPAGGSILWLQLQGKTDGTKLYRRALQDGISIVPGEVFSASGKHRSFIRISCGSPWSSRIERALATLAQLARE
jgi:DNA-binding transcriptional MocR family regulator